MIEVIKAKTSRDCDTCEGRIEVNEEFTLFGGRTRECSRCYPIGRRQDLIEYIVHFRADEYGISYNVKALDPMSAIMKARVLFDKDAPGVEPLFTQFAKCAELEESILSKNDL